MSSSLCHKGANGQNDRVVTGAQVLDRKVDSDVDAALENGALGLHLLDPAVEEGLVHFEVGDPVTDEATRPVVTLVDDHLVAGPGELLGRRHPRRPGTDHRHPLGRPDRRAHRCDPAVFPGVVNDLLLDVLYRHGVVVYRQHASALARRRAHPPRELGEIVRGVQAVYGVSPAVAVNEVVPVGYQVAQRAPARGCCKTVWRSPCSATPVYVNVARSTGSYISAQSRTRIWAGRCSASRRLCFMKPSGSAMRRGHHDRRHRFWLSLR